MGIINGMTGLRLDFVVYNDVNNTTFESRNVHPTYHSSLTAPMSHYKYNKWYDSVPLPQQLDCPNVSLWPKIHTIPCKIVCAWISASLPEQLDCKRAQDVVLVT
eukprot:scaffold21020_cov67-Cyclotella_meneghiniana.AAC.1